MSIIYTPTATEQRRATRDALVLKVAEAAHHLASVATSAFTEFWSAEPVQLVTDLNADVSASIAKLSANAALAGPVNAQLDSLGLPQFTARIPASTPPAFSFDGTQFVYTPPPVPEPIEIDP